MSRKPRNFLENVPYHIVQRGNNKSQIFQDDNDYIFFLKTLFEAKIKYPCLIYSYCLMGNHFHLLIESNFSGNNISFLIKFLGVKYVGYFNKKYNRSGTLWEGRFKSSLVSKEFYFLACLRYIETNPIRAGLVKYPELYRWSTYRARAFGEENSIIDLDQYYPCLGNTTIERQINYRLLCRGSDPKWV